MGGSAGSVVAVTLPTVATKEVSVGSFFERSHLDLRQAVQLMYFWAAEIDKEEFVMAQIGIGSKHTVVDYKNFCREIPAQYSFCHHLPNISLSAQPKKNHHCAV